MKCHNPYFDIGMAFPCGKCPSCLSTRRRTWAARIQLEALHHKGRTNFVTLTYSGDATTLNISHVQLWLKRLRKRAGRLRVFYCGEYGDRTQRPHYHAVLFGLPRCAGGPITRHVGGGFSCLCDTCSAVRETWGYGHTTVSPLTPERAMYVSGYVVKKMTHRLDPRLQGREPEFARMSLRPGIGAVAIQPVVYSCRSTGRTVPGGLRFGTRILPIGRYLRKKIASELADGNEAHSQAWLGTQGYAAQQKAALSALRSYARSVDKPVEKAWRQVLEETGFLLVIPDFPTIHRPITTKEV